MKKLVIIGGGGHAQVVLDMILAINRSQPTYEVIGIFDDQTVPIILDHIRIGSIADLSIYTRKAEFVIAIGNNDVRKKIAEQNTDKQFATLIHPTAIIGQNVTVGEGTIIMAGSILQANVTIGKHTIVNTGSVVDHDVVIGDYSHIAQRVTLTGGVQVGSQCLIGAGSVVAPWQKIENKTILSVGTNVQQEVKG
ncbi:MAG: acetyltransferase [Culicoidibacterales bacterium]